MAAELVLVGRGDHWSVYSDHFIHSVPRATEQKSTVHRRLFCGCRSDNQPLQCNHAGITDKAGLLLRSTLDGVRHLDWAAVNRFADHPASQQYCCL